MTIFQNDVIFGSTSGCSFDYFGIAITSVGQLLSVGPSMVLVEARALGRRGTGAGAYAAGAALTVGVARASSWGGGGARGRALAVAFGTCNQFAISIAANMTWLITPEVSAPPPRKRPRETTRRRVALVVVSRRRHSRARAAPPTPSRYLSLAQTRRRSSIRRARDAPRSPSATPRRASRPSR